MAITEVVASNVAAEELEALTAFAESRPSSELRDAVLSLARSVHDGADVAMMETTTELTPAQVGKLLNMSRTHLYKLLDNGALSSHRVGRDRRVRVADVIAFQRRRDNDRRELAERFAHSRRTSEGAIDELLEEL